MDDIEPEADADVAASRGRRGGPGARRRPATHPVARPGVRRAGRGRSVLDAPPVGVPGRHVRRRRHRLRAAAHAGHRRDPVAGRSPHEPPRFVAADPDRRVRDDPVRLGPGACGRGRPAPAHLRQPHAGQRRGARPGAAGGPVRRGRVPGLRPGRDLHRARPGPGPTVRGPAGGRGRPRRPGRRHAGDDHRGPVGLGLRLRRYAR